MSTDHKPLRPHPADYDPEVQAVLGRAAPPSPAKLFRVAAGLEAWTPEEDRWVNDNPAWAERIQRLREELDLADERRAPVVRLSEPWLAEQATSGAYSITLQFAADELMLVGKAKAECMGQVVAKLVSTEEGLAMWLFKGASEDLTGVRFVGKRRPGHITLRAGGHTISLQSPIDKHGYSSVRTADIAPFIRNKQSIEVIIH